MDLYSLMYIVLLIVPFFISYKYATSIVKKSGLFIAPMVLALAFNLTLGVVVILGWLTATLFTFEMAFLGGLYIGSIILIVSECILLFILLLQRKKLLILYQDNLKTQLN
jgi:hypothetical protein